MFLSRRLFVALIDVPCKSSHRIVRLPSVRDCHPDGGDCASEDDRTRGGREDKRRSRGREEVERMRRPRG
jgi:hypothetical protein